MVWVEKYRPKYVRDCILPARIRAKAEGFVKAGKMPNLLLSGPAGTGKTTLARALCDELGYEVLFINGSDEGRFLDTLRTSITNFASTLSFTAARKVVIIDEADHMPADTVQAALRSFTEQFASNCSFIFTCNFPNRIMEAIHSRCTEIDFTMTKDESLECEQLMFKRVIDILGENDVKYDKKYVAKFVMKAAPDWRRMLNDLQGYSSTGLIDAGILNAGGNIQMEELFKMLKEKDFRSMRTWVATTASLDMTVLCRRVYDSMYDHVAPTSIPQLVLDLADYQYKHAFVADKEINIVAMLTTLMMNLEFK